MGALKYTITVESDKPPAIMLGQDIGGGIVKELKEVEVELVSAKDLANTYGVSVDTVRRKCDSINQGGVGKYLYNPKLADALLKANGKSSRGRKRVN